MESLLAGKRFYCREWAFQKLAEIILDKKSEKQKAGVLILGSPGCGKTAFLSELCFPEIGSKKFKLPYIKNFHYLNLRHKKLPYIPYDWMSHFFILRQHKE